ncbi:hypothetical protein [uncultured Mediterranean phage uvMED]|nr:hypothetical protein [uncultured Mediterranean phage uvMED]
MTNAKTKTVIDTTFNEKLFKQGMELIEQSFQGFVNDLSGIEKSDFDGAGVQETAYEMKRILRAVTRLPKAVQSSHMYKLEECEAKIAKRVQDRLPVGYLEKQSNNHMAWHARYNEIFEATKLIFKDITNESYVPQTKSDEKSSEDSDQVLLRIKQFKDSMK